MIALQGSFAPFAGQSTVPSLYSPLSVINCSYAVSVKSESPLAGALQVANCLAQAIDKSMGVASCRPRPSRWSGRATRALVVLVDWALDAKGAGLTAVAAGSGLNDVGGQRAPRGFD